MEPRHRPGGPERRSDVLVSGWDLDERFFVEKTDLVWSQNGDKKVLLHHALPAGTIIFVRLQAPESTGSPVPVTHQVVGMQPMDCNGQCEMRLAQLRPRSKESIAGEFASKLQADSSSMYESSEGSMELEPEEVLQ